MNGFVDDFLCELCAQPCSAIAGNEQPPQDVLDMRRATGLEAGQEVGTEIADAVILGILQDCLPRTRCAVVSVLW